jgi:hypothetical protein
MAESGRIRIRRDFAPLSVSVSLACATDYSPVTQAYDPAQGTYEPDRSITPTLLRPTVSANAADGSWTDYTANSHLADMQWLVNGVDISTLTDWTDKYEIETVGVTRGSLLIKRNLAPAERLSLQFKANLVDNRLGVTIPILTDPVILSVVDKADASYSVSLDCEKTIRYNPFNDKLFLYEYKVAHGLQEASTAAYNAALADSGSYLRTISARLYKGGTLMQASGFTTKIYKVENESTFTELEMAVENGTDSWAYTLDLRMLEKANYMIKAFVDDTEVGRIQFSIARDKQSFTCRPTNETDILPSQHERYDVVQVDSSGKIVECPESILKILWYTDSATVTEMQHNEGKAALIDLAAAGVGQNYNDDWLDVYVSAAPKGVFELAADENGDILTDENGENFIIN